MTKSPITTDSVGQQTNDRHCLIIGGNGYIGRSFARYALDSGLFGRVTLADLTGRPRFETDQQIEYRLCDVRQPLEDQLGPIRADWILNLAAVHREPGHPREAYFDTNVRGAENICEYATNHQIKNLLFTSSIAVYGPTSGPTDESVTPRPDTAYGISKLIAEKVQLGWGQADSSRRVVIVRPGVVYGPGDKANIVRMIHALQLGVFAIPGDPRIRKSYAYIKGLCEAFAFTMGRSDQKIIFNYVEAETQPLAELIDIIQDEFNINHRVRRIPLKALEAIAKTFQIFSAGRSSIHPVRVQKVARPTQIDPAWLKLNSFPFTRDFRSSLKEWRDGNPQDFFPNGVSRTRITAARLIRGIESLISRQA